MKLFKIRNQEGLFSTGGSTPSWRPKGKTWVALNHLTAHLSMIRRERERFVKGLKDPLTAQRYEATRRYATFDKTKDPYANCTVLEFETIEMKATPITKGSM
jgi:hypothetical protein